MLMLFLTCLSVPAIDTVHMFRLTAPVDDVDKSLDFGLWSYCVSNPIKKAGRLVLLFSGATFYLNHPVSATHIPAIGKYSNPTLGYVVDEEGFAAENLYGKCIPFFFFHSRDLRATSSLVLRCTDSVRLSLCVIKSCG